MPIIPTIAQAESNLRLWKSIHKCYQVERIEIEDRFKQGRITSQERDQILTNLDFDTKWIVREIESNQIIKNTFAAV